MSIFSIVPPLIYSLYLLWHAKGAKLVSQVFWFAAFIALVEASGVLTAKILHSENNFWIAYVYIPLEYALLAFMYRGAFASKTIRSGILLSVVFFFMVCVAEVILSESLKSYNSYSRAIESVLMVMLPLLYFYQIFQNPEKASLWDDPYFLLSVGAIFYFAGSSVVTSLYNVLLAYSVEYILIGYLVLFVLNTFFNTMLVLVLRRARRT